MIYNIKLVRLIINKLFKSKLNLLPTAVWQNGGFSAKLNIQFSKEV
jgi:hypothetical protein